MSQSATLEERAVAESVRAQLTPAASPTRDKTIEKNSYFDWSRVVDIVVALSAIIFFLPLFVVLILAVRLSDGGPAFFGHVRIGRGGAPFRCLKFRSMVVDADVRLKTLLANDPLARQEWERDQKLRRDPRITRLGQFLRKSSLDELPQLFNVLVGEMSIVGPRPIVQAEVERYGRAYRHYCQVRPGITGLWQVSGRNDTTYQRRVAIDRLYAQSKSLSLDAQIVLKTIPAVLLRKGSF
jgi:lipopolysaccharide/colanic/teichoic acid biosynthesis glycosyltransferase